MVDISGQLSEPRALAARVARRAWSALDPAASSVPPVDRRDMGPVLLAAIDRVRPLTMTSPERLQAVWDSVHYVVANRIPGAFVECGVWRGGSTMMAALAFQAQSVEDRDLYLFDTFEGMPDWTSEDVDWRGRSADEVMAGQDRETSRLWAYAGIQEVRKNLASVGYPEARVHFVAGKVEDTLPEQAPEQIALLRLDTDWYESTKHELEHLIPRLAPHGVLIVDDYGHWQGARRAVDEWLADFDRPVLLTRTDYTGRLAVIPG